MSNARCIYCKNELVGGVTDGRQASMEHIIQYALGGSDNLVTFDCCNACNSTLGDTVDAAFINEPVIGLQRLHHKIAGYSGKVPDVVLKARETESRELGRIHFGTEAVYAKHNPIVIKDLNPDGTGEVYVAGPTDVVRPVVEGMLKKAKGRGHELRLPDGTVAETFEQLAAAGERGQFQQYRGQMNVSLESILRGYAKIAFGFAHLTLGEEWTYGEGAELLRKAARGVGTFGDVEGIAMGAGKAMRQLYIPMQDDADNLHLVALLHGQAKILVSLFGGEMSYAFDLGTVDMELQESAMVDGKFAVIVDCTTRKVRHLTVEDQVMAIQQRG